MKFTKSQDGIPRATIRTSIRLSREELSMLKRCSQVKASGGDILTLLQSLTADEVQRLLDLQSEIESETK